MRAESRHSSQMPTAKSALIYPEENQRVEEEGVEEDKRSKRRKREVRRHPWVKQGKQETKTTYGGWSVQGPQCACSHVVHTASPPPDPKPIENRLPLLALTPYQYPHPYDL